MAVTGQLGVRGLTDEDWELLEKVEAEHNLSHAQMVSAGLRLLEASYAAEDEAAGDPSREDRETVEKALRGVSDTVCDVLRGYAAKAAEEVDDARREARDAVEKANAAVSGLASAKAEADRETSRLQEELDAKERTVRELMRVRDDRDEKLVKLDDEVAELRRAKAEAERKLLESVETEREAVAEAAGLREKLARLEGKLSVLEGGRGGEQAADAGEAPADGDEQAHAAAGA